ncbi:MAG TPA: glycerate kinase [Tepidisphaeraceae bacterium]|nr:glycerate kinase [Tepidisphaeraceae bacterium]
MKIVIAPDKFKGCLNAADVAEAIAVGARSVDASLALDLCPMADGGEGTVAALVAATGGRLVTRRVVGPLSEMSVDATFGFLGDDVTAVIEMSAASGLALLKPQDRNPLNTTTFGTGQLIAAAIGEGASQIILGIGGSATIDAGIGCAQACRFTLLMRDGELTSMTEPLCGRDLPNVLMVKHGRGEITNGVQITVACDVTNPLFGDNGAARVFGPQKGASPADVERIDADFLAFAERTGKMAEAQSPGAGAAGGLGFGMTAFFGATLRSGVDLVADAVGLRGRLRGASLCITGEGQLDGTSAHGKTVGGVARLCRELGVPCIALAGSIGDGAEQMISEGLTAHFSICDRPMTMNESCRDARTLLSRVAANVMRAARSSPPPATLPLK